MAWRGCLVKWTKTEIINSCGVTRGSRWPPRPQQSRGFRREPRRGETRKGNVAEETTPPPAEAPPPPGPPPPPPPRAPRPSLLTPLMFTVGFTGCSFSAAAILQYESLKSQVQTAREEQEAERTGQVQTAREEQEAERTGQQSQDMAYWHRWWAGLSELQRRSILLLSTMDDFWSGLTEGQRTATGIIAINTVVLCCWRIPSLQRSMIKYFTANPASKTRCLPMLLSSFSHFSLLHLSANMYVLWTFSSSIVSLLGREQFLALYLSSGVISTMVSYMCKTATGRLHPSLGASGAIMAVLAAVCTKVPEAKLGIILLPMVSFTAGNALKAIVAMDAAGLLLGWRLFDHAAHLGGALFGVWYVAYGHRLIWRKREPLVTFWHSLRSGGRGGGGGA